MKKESITTSTPFQTKKIAEIFAKKLLFSKRKKGVVLGLIGELGSGKTTFLKGFAKGLGIKEKILSPTFLILKKFKINQVQKLPAMTLKFDTFYHIDCYRVKEPKEILNLGFKEIVSKPQNIIAIEWADRIKEILPKETIFLKFKFIDKKKRKIIINSPKTNTQKKNFVLK
jgi:tRNA threonylcarbamoyladenosine biosynthesis protein TsaE